MNSPSLPNIRSLRTLSNAHKCAALDLLFEPSPEIHKTLIPVSEAAEYTSYNEFIESCRQALVSMASQSTTTRPNETLLAILGSHPRLGAKKVESAQSAAEQAKLGGGESEALARLNRDYEQRFPGLRYVVFVNGRGREDIMRDMEARIARGDFGKEVDAALHAMCDIARDRAAKLPVQAADHL
ncbi:Oxo-4-hydroxy-4-carboxy-5-ureidoimidazoline decarboxylase [Cordyceps militaris CM01]|uniref:Oxo-4-hydroxy-4-carboxy-5-ureidoimidazoline decarboxylase n=2 Tax=Cordyceps militaris TaxID=73501 RepID=G3J836_CORMM|nr:Oxo-4-hydroxy-4-carboxy-5-ureidoimidazoline decarboxylase [Cordyceps militaris CM01]ATY60814.1 Oxo-4-hydroxy-4-carboxy-5-ureidoimidazoline decarboxylase [Cordyceps militaris]EGX93878.1 Oxo-4-hydroxy-4-carboxy-5-ureidoimidazoline decarboxylase [Cordyceps militaris CM01]